MKRYLSSLILLGTLAVMLLVLLATLWASGRLVREPAVFGDRRTGRSGLYRVEQGALRVNINEVDAGTLQLFAGIGETLSRQIVEYRAENGPFRSVDELTEVPGIGEGKLEAIRDLIYCD